MRSNQKLGRLSAGHALRATGTITSEELQEVVEEHRATGESMVDIIIDRSLATEFDLAKALVRELQLPFLSPLAYQIADEARTVLTPEMLHQHRVVPLDRFGDTLVLCTVGDLDTQRIAELQSECGLRIAFVIGIRGEIKEKLDVEFPLPKGESLQSLGQEVSSRFDELFGS